MWHNIIQPKWPKMTILRMRMRIALWIPKATNTHSNTVYIILIDIPLQLWLHGRASMLRYTYKASDIHTTISRPKRHVVIFSLQILEKIMNVF
jgi:hypothetical protein